MKILVPVKRVVDYNVKIRVKPDGSGLTCERKNVDEPVLRNCRGRGCAFRKPAKQVKLLVSVGPSQAQKRSGQRSPWAQIAVFLCRQTTIWSLGIAKLLKAVIAEENPDLVILGKQAIDGDNNQTGQMLAALLGWPQGTFASALDFADDKLQVTREIDGGLQTVKLTTPAVVTTDLG